MALAAPRATAADAPPGSDACNWSSFRNGPRNSGASACQGLGLAEVPALTPSFLYRTRDSVTSTPAVVDGVLYVGAWDGSFYAFEVARHARVPAVGDPSLPSAVPTVAPRWEHRIDDTNGVSFGRIVSSPTVADVAGTRVVVFAGGATVYVLAADDGEVLAQSCLDPRDHDRCSGSGDSEIEIETSPVVLPERDGSATVLSGLDVHNESGIGRTGVVKLRLRRGGTKWTLKPEWKFDPEARAPTTGPDLLTAGSGTGGGCGGVWGTPAVDAAADVVVFGTASCSSGTSGPDGVPGSGDEEVRGEEIFGISLRDGTERWRRVPARPYGPHTDDDFGASPQLWAAGRRLVAGIGGKDGWYYALDAKDGSLVWSSHVGQAGRLEGDFAVGGVLGSPALGAVGDEDAIFVTTAISTPVGAPLDRGSAESLDRTLAEDPGRMLSLHAIRRSDGSVLWRQPLTRQTYGHPTFADGIVFVPSTASASVQAFDAATGAPVWTSPPLNGAPSSGVAVTQDGVFIGTGTRQTDAGFKLTGEDSLVADLAGSDPQERASGIWGFSLLR